MTSLSTAISIKELLHILPSPLVAKQKIDKSYVKMSLLFKKKKRKGAGQGGSGWRGMKGTKKSKTKMYKTCHFSSQNILKVKPG
jgi:hypothetical protein